MQISGPTPDLLKQKLWAWGLGLWVSATPPGDSEVRRSLRDAAFHKLACQGSWSSFSAGFALSSVGEPGIIPRMPHIEKDNTNNHFRAAPGEFTKRSLTPPVRRQCVPGLRGWALSWTGWGRSSGVLGGYLNSVNLSFLVWKNKGNKSVCPLGMQGEQVRNSHKTQGWPHSKHSINTSYHYFVKPQSGDYFPRFMGEETTAQEC